MVHLAWVILLIHGCMMGVVIVIFVISFIAIAIYISRNPGMFMSRREDFDDMELHSHSRVDRTRLLELLKKFPFGIMANTSKKECAICLDEFRVRDSDGNPTQIV